MTVRAYSAGRSPDSRLQTPFTRPSRLQEDSGTPLAGGRMARQLQ